MTATLNKPLYALALCRRIRAAKSEGEALAYVVNAAHNGELPSRETIADELDAVLKPDQLLEDVLADLVRVRVSHGSDYQGEGREPRSRRDVSVRPSELVIDVHEMDSPWDMPDVLRFPAFNESCTGLFTCEARLTVEERGGRRVVMCEIEVLP